MCIILRCKAKKFYTFLSIMEKDLRYVELFEIYSSLLTTRQRELFSSHYLYDLSLSEIAEPEGYTRQSVYSAIKKVKQKLDEYESQLNLYQKRQDFTSLAKEIRKSDKEISDRILEIIGK